ncbi:MAG: hypothetical protein P4L61_02030 [Candidatus Pacebacteria bacterium]|nr:hypothetical protein [Candidatus Paceibacterota bacterium]
MFMEAVVSWGEIGEMTRAIGPAVTAGAACAGALIAYRGLEKWRHETIGRKRIELAEDVLADFYEAVDVIQFVRVGFSYFRDNESRPGRDQEPENVQNHRDQYYATERRLKDQAAFFAKFQSRRYRVIAVFGTEASKLYEEVIGIHNLLFTALIALTSMSPLQMSIQGKERRDKSQLIIWGGEPDEIKTKLDMLILRVEKTFRHEAAKGRR